jgi:hypothetical protein
MSSFAIKETIKETSPNCCSLANRTVRTNLVYSFFIFLKTGLDSICRILVLSQAIVYLPSRQPISTYHYAPIFVLEKGTAVDATGAPQQRYGEDDYYFLSFF